MARSRNIKPGLFDNEELAELGAEGQLLFIGLWTRADRRGVLEDRPRRIKAQIFPYSEYDVASLLTMLAERKFIIRYEVDGHKCIYIPNFEKHQTPHQKEPENDLPMPSEADLEKYRTCPGQASDKSEMRVISKRESVRGNQQSGKRESGKRESERASGFDAFYRQYPRHVGRSDALKAWKRLSPDEQAAALASVAPFAASPKGQGDFCPYPATWLNQHRWLDDPQEWQRGGEARAGPARQPSIYGGGLEEVF